MTEGMSDEEFDKNAVGHFEHRYMYFHGLSAQ